MIRHLKSKQLVFLKSQVIKLKEIWIYKTENWEQLPGISKSYLNQSTSDVCLLISGIHTSMAMLGDHSDSRFNRTSD